MYDINILQQQRNAMKNIKELLKNPKNWTTHALARNEKGQFCKINDPNIKALCLTGAIFKEFDHYPELPAQGIGLMEIISQTSIVCNTTLADFNDTTTHKTLMAAINETIETINHKIGIQNDIQTSN